MDSWMMPRLVRNKPLANLHRILLHESGTHRLYMLSEHNTVKPEKGSKIGHHCHIASREAIDGLPVIPNTEKACAWGGLENSDEKPRLRRRDVLKLID
jgi:hypothetical protein